MAIAPRAESHGSPPAIGLGRGQLAWLAAAVVVVSAGHGALMPLLPAWLAPLMTADGQAEVARHVGLPSGICTSADFAGSAMAGRTGVDGDQPRRTHRP